MIKILDHPLVAHSMTQLRDKNSTSEQFRSAARRICYHLAIEATKNLETTQFEIKTPLESLNGKEISDSVVLLPVLRAGLVMLEPFLDLIPQAKTGYAGMRRNEKTLEAEEYYFSIPRFDSNTQVIVLDVMLATGNTAAATLSRLEFEGAVGITVASIIAAPDGIEKIRSEFPDVRIITATLDRGLNKNGYIVPGLGDAGDRVNATF